MIDKNPMSFVGQRFKKYAFVVSHEKESHGEKDTRKDLKANKERETKWLIQERTG